MNMLDLTDKIILITGAGKSDGQGAAEAGLLNQCGATVYIADVIGDTGKETAKNIGEGVFYKHLDVTSEENWSSVVEEIHAEHGRIDGLVNNAGVWSGPGIMGTSLEDFQRVIAINQVGVFLGIRAVAPFMCEARSGSIVNIASAASLRIGVYYWHNTMTAHAYTVTKWAVRGMTKATSMEFAPYDVRVNSIHPGPIHTSMLGGNLDDIAASVPMKRLGVPSDIAGTVAFLMSDLCPYMTGADLAIDGAATV